MPAYLRRVLPLGEHRIPDGATVLPLEDASIVARSAAARPRRTVVSDDELIAAVGGGIVKVNIGTVRDTSQHDAALVDSRRHLASAPAALTDTLGSVLRLLAATTTRAR